MEWNEEKYSKLKKNSNCRLEKFLYNQNFILLTRLELDFNNACKDGLDYMSIKEWEKYFWTYIMYKRFKRSSLQELPQKKMPTTSFELCSRDATVSAVNKLPLHRND